MLIRKPKRPPKNHPVIAFDTETVGDKRRFVHGVVVRWDGAYHFDDPVAMREFLLSPEHEGAFIYATNAEYDITALWGEYPPEMQVLYAGSRFIKATIRPRKGGKVITFLDTWNLTNKMSVSKMGKAVHCPKFETPPELTGKKPSTPWCCIKHHKEYCVECYCERDATITYKFARLLQDTIRDLGAEVKPTIGGMGIDLWKRRFLPDGLERPPDIINEAVRPAYHGGYVVNHIIGKIHNVTSYDVNSLYPYVHVAYDYPHPNHLTITRHRAASKEYIWRYEGISKVDIEIPKGVRPILPVTLKDRVFYPYGKLTGIWTHPELREQVRRGAKITKVYWNIFSYATIRPFKDYMTTLYQLRLKFKEQGNPAQKCIKLLMNAPTGRIGLRKDNNLYYLKSMDRINTLDEIQGKKIIDIHGTSYLCEPLNQNYKPDYVNVMWAAYQTAYARLEVIRLSEKANALVVYNDTDCVHTLGTLPTGKGLGQLKKEWENRSVVYKGPKFYYTVDGKKPFISRIRGIPRFLHKMFIRDGEVHFKTPARPKEAARLGVRIGDWVKRVKRECEIYPKGKPIKHITENGDYWLTTPWHIDELVKLLEKAPPPPWPKYPVPTPFDID